MILEKGNRVLLSKSIFLGCFENMNENILIRKECKLSKVKKKHNFKLRKFF